jgi:hypothetical protein
MDQLPTREGGLHIASVIALRFQLSTGFRCSAAHGFHFFNDLLFSAVALKQSALGTPRFPVRGLPSDWVGSSFLFLILVVIAFCGTIMTWIKRCSMEGKMV